VCVCVCMPKTVRIELIIPQIYRVVMLYFDLHIWNAS
jgi:hypothetical protein